MTKKTKQTSISRRHLLEKGVSAATLMGAASVLGAPSIANASGKPIKIGVVHPVTGSLQFPGQQCRLGVLTAIKEINANGGIKSMGGRKIEAVLGDAQSKAEVGAAEVEKFNDAGVSSIIGAYASGISLATTQAAAKYGIPHVVDVGVNDKMVSRGLENTFRFGPGFGTIVETGVNSLVEINNANGGVAKM